MSPRKRAAPRCSGRDGEPEAEEARGARKAPRASAAKELSPSCLPDEPRRPPSPQPQDPPAPGRRLSFVPAALAAACDDAGTDVPEEPGWAGFSMSELPQPLLWQSSKSPDDKCDDDRTKPPDPGTRFSPSSASINRCSGGGDASSVASRTRRVGTRAASGSVVAAGSGVVAAGGGVIAATAASAEQVPSVDAKLPTALIANRLHMPRVVAGTRRSTFGCERVSLRQAEPLCDVAGSASAEGHVDTSLNIPMEAKLKARARACLQEAVRRLNGSISTGLEGMQQFLVEACEASDRAIDAATGDEFLSQSSLDRAASFQASRSSDPNHRLNLRLGRECRQWDNLVQSYHANADRAQSELAASTTRAVASGTCVPVVHSADSVRDNESIIRELTAAVERSHVQSLLAGRRLTRAIAAARQFNVVAAARAADEAAQLASAVIPDTPRQPLSRVLGRR